MTSCRGHSSACLAEEAHGYHDALDRKRRVLFMCNRCAAALNAMGAGLVRTSRAAAPLVAFPLGRDGLGRSTGRLSLLRSRFAVPGWASGTGPGVR